MPNTRSRRARRSVAARSVERDELTRAVALQRGGKLDKAERIYRRVLKGAPEQVDALHFLGVLQHQRGRSAQGVRLIEQAVRLAPDYTDAHNNLGNVFKETGRLAEAVAAYQRVVELDPGHADAWSNLGVVLRAEGQYEAAEQAYAHAIEARPDHVVAWQNRGNLLARMDRLEEAVSAYLRVLELQPHDTRAFDALGKTLYRARRIDEAVEVYREWLRQAPDNSVACHMLAACTGEAVPERAADDYVRELFDDFASSFDQVLDQIGYRAPALIGARLDRLLSEPDRSLRIADLGCGTGLCAEFLRPRARRLTGVDLSPAMLARARARQQYDQLVEAELSAWLGGQRGVFDLLVSADTLCYFGALDGALRGAAEALRAGGQLVFTVELAEDQVSSYRLGPSGRYRHAEGYVRAQVAVAGLELDEIESVVLRREGAAEVAGLLVSARRREEATRSN